jgi:hypothetical protein
VAGERLTAAGDKGDHGWPLDHAEPEIHREVREILARAPSYGM